MQLIDATKAIESIDEIVCSMSVCINSDYYNGMRSMKDMALHAIEKQPTVDAVQVVRCGECSHSEVCKMDEGDVRYCHIFEMQTEDDYYCADGERKEE